LIPNPQDTIVALATAPGPGLRAIVRLSGPDALRVTDQVFHGPAPEGRQRRSITAGAVQLPGVHAPLPAERYFFPAPRTYTSQEMVELHTLSSPPLVELLVTQCLQAGARAAQPGEFTLRAFLAGKLDLTQAEAVLGVIAAGSRDELKQALAQLAGGIALPLQALREDLLNLLADVEAGLDFIAEDIHFVSQRELLDRLAKGLAHVTLIHKQMGERSLAPRPFRVVLAGKPNAGKSSLFNALAGKKAALVSPMPGTTRDYLVHTLDCDGVKIELLDTAGLRTANGHIEAEAQELAKDEARRADLILLCQEAGKAADPDALSWLDPAAGPRVLRVGTKCDLAEGEPGVLATSAVSGAGLNELRTILAEHARASARPALAPSLSRCRHHVEACIDHLRQAHGHVLNDGPAEILAVDLRLALDELGAMVGAVYTDDLLDRIFSRFCIGK